LLSYQPTKTEPYRRLVKPVQRLSKIKIVIDFARAKRDQVASPDRCVLRQKQKQRAFCVIQIKSEML